MRNTDLCNPLFEICKIKITPFLQQESNERWATNKGPAKTDDDLYALYSQLSYKQLNQFYDMYLEDCVLFDFKCEETLCKIKRWKALHEKR